jgi:hypothetical protein
MANPIEESLISASELLEEKPPRVVILDPLADHAPLDAEAVIAILKAHHTATVLLGLLESNKRNKGRQEQMRRLALGLTRHLELLASYVHAQSGDPR